jgi:hypothetical protein
MDDQNQILEQLRERVAQLETRGRPSKAVLTLIEAAIYIGRSASTLRALHAAGRGPHRTRSGQKWLYKISDLDRWIDEQDAE